MESNFFKLLTEATKTAATAPSSTDPINPEEIRAYIDDSFEIAVGRRWMSEFYAKSLASIAKSVVISQCWSMTHAVGYVYRLIHENKNPVTGSLLMSRKPSLVIPQEMMGSDGDVSDEEEGEMKRSEEEEDEEDWTTLETNRVFSDSFEDSWAKDKRKKTEARLGRNLEKFVSAYVEREKDLIPEMVDGGRKRRAKSEPPENVKIAKMSDDGDANM